MKAALFTGVLNTLLLGTVLALDPPLSSQGFQSVFLGTTSHDYRYANKSLTTFYTNLQIVFMGNQGINIGNWAQYGWNDETGTLAQKVTIPDGIHLSPSQLEYTWEPLEFGVAVADTAPASGLSIPRFHSNNAMTGPVWRPTLIANPFGKLGMVAPDGNYVSKWYACGGTTVSTISWSFGDAAPTNSDCVAVEIFKVDNTGLPARRRTRRRS